MNRMGLVLCPLVQHHQRFDQHHLIIITTTTLTVALLRLSSQSVAHIVEESPEQRPMLAPAPFLTTLRVDHLSGRLITQRRLLGQRFLAHGITATSPFYNRRSPASDVHFMHHRWLMVLHHLTQGHCRRGWCNECCWTSGRSSRARAATRRD